MLCMREIHIEALLQMLRMCIMWGHPFHTEIVVPPLSHLCIAPLEPTCGTRTKDRSSPTSSSGGQPVVRSSRRIAWMLIEGGGGSGGEELYATINAC
jgi:hypothetical protein